MRQESSDQKPNLPPANRMKQYTAFTKPRGFSAWFFHFIAGCRGLDEFKSSTFKDWVNRQITREPWHGINVFCNLEIFPFRDQNNKNDMIRSQINCPSSQQNATICSPPEAGRMSWKAVGSFGQWQSGFKKVLFVQAAYNCSIHPPLFHQQFLDSHLLAYYKCKYISRVVESATYKHLNWLAEPMENSRFPKQEYPKDFNITMILSNHPIH